MNPAEEVTLLEEALALDDGARENPRVLDEITDILTRAALRFIQPGLSAREIVAREDAFTVALASEAEAEVPYTLAFMADLIAGIVRHLPASDPWTRLRAVIPVDQRGGEVKWLYAGLPEAEVVDAPRGVFLPNARPFTSYLVATDLVAPSHADLDRDIWLSGVAEPITRTGAFMIAAGQEGPEAVLAALLALRAVRADTSPLGVASATWERVLEPCLRFLTHRLRAYGTAGPLVPIVKHAHWFAALATCLVDVEDADRSERISDFEGREPAVPARLGLAEYPRRARLNRGRDRQP